MKRLFICLLSLMIIFTGCSQYRGDKTDKSNTSNENNEDCNAPGFFSNLEDFYKFATSGSRNPEDYINSYTASNIDWYPSINPNAFLKLEDLFNDTNLTNNIEKVLINPDVTDCYYYTLKSNITITVRYYSQGAPSIDTDTIKEHQGVAKCIQEDEKSCFSTSAEIGNAYIKTVDEATIIRLIEKPYKTAKTVDYRFIVVIGKHEIEISTYCGKYSSQEELLNDPANQFIHPFLSNSELPEAINTLKSCIAKNQ